MTQNFMGYNNPYQPQMQRLNQLMQDSQQYQPTNYQPQPQNKVLMVASEDIAKNTQIPLDGTTTYFVYGDTILARNWNIAMGSIENKTFKLQEGIIDTPEQKDSIKTILAMLESIDKKVTPQPTKKEVKDVK